MSKPIRIVSDGTGPGTKVFDASGHQLEGVSSVRWEIRAGDDRAVATITFDDISVILDGEQA